MNNLKVKYCGVHAIIFSSESYGGLVYPNDIISINKKEFDKIKNREENGNKVWVEVKEEKLKKEVKKEEEEKEEEVKEEK